MLKKAILVAILMAATYGLAAHAEESEPLYTFEHAYRILDADGNPVHSLVVTGGIPMSYADQIVVYYKSVQACMSGEAKMVYGVLTNDMSPRVRAMTE